MKDLTTRDYEGFKQFMLMYLKSKIPEYTDFSDHDPGVVIIQSLAYALDGLSYYLDKASNEAYLEDAQVDEDKIKIANTMDYTIKGSKPSIFKQVVTIIPQEEDTLILQKGDIITTHEVNVEDRIEFEVVKDLIIPKGMTGLEKDEKGEYKYFTLVQQGHSVHDVILGTSRGIKYQKFKLPDLDIIDNSITVYVNEGENYVEWKRVDSFINNTDDNIYRVLFDGLHFNIQFGNGVMGKIPSPHINGILAEYRIGGGTIGNVGENTITIVENKPAVLKETFNVGEPVQYGEDIEDLDDLPIKVPASIKTLERAVTEEDYEDIALSKLSYIDKIKAIAIPKSLDMNVYIKIKKMDTIPEIYLSELNNFYDKVKMMNTNVTIHPPDFISTNLKITLWLFEKMRNKEEILKDIEECIKGYFLTLNFYEEVNSSILISNLMDIIGIKSVYVEITNPYEIKPNQIATLGNIDYDIRGGTV